VNYPVETAQVDVVNRDGVVTRMTATNGTIPLTISPSPLYIVNVPCTARFSDVCPDHWAYTYIEYLAQQGVVGGYSDGTFRPNNTATRAQIAKMIVTARNWPLTVPSSPSFSDVPGNDAFYPYIETAKARGILGGYSDGTFRPANPVSRGQISKLIVLAYGWALTTPATPSFSDVPPGSTYYSYVETAKAHGAVGGYSDGTFRPAASATRAQLSKMLYLAMTTP
jgi:hypothetical protein